MNITRDTLNEGDEFLNHFGKKCRITAFDNNPKNKPVIALNLESGKTCFYHFKQITLIKSSKIQLVVMDEHTLGYIDPISPNYMGVFHGSVLKGSPYGGVHGPVFITGEKIRLATKKDFEDFRVAWAKAYDDPNEHIYDSSETSEN